MVTRKLNNQKKSYNFIVITSLMIKKCVNIGFLSTDYLILKPVAQGDFLMFLRLHVETLSRLFAKCAGL